MYHVHIMNELANFLRQLNYGEIGAGDLSERVCVWLDTRGASLIPDCPPGHEMVALPIDHDDRESTPSATAKEALAMLDFGLAFALCNMDHGGTRRDVKKAQKVLEDLKALLQKEAVGTGKTETVVTKNEDGIIICVREMSAEGQVLRVIAQSSLTKVEELQDEVALKNAIIKDYGTKIDELQEQLKTSRADDRSAMGYLQDVRNIVGGDDFPAMVQKIREMAEGAKA